MGGLCGGGAGAGAGAGAGGGGAIALRVAHGLRMLEVEASERWSVGRLKEHLAGETGVPPEAQELLLRGRKLPDGKPLVDAGLRARAKLILAERPGWRRGAGEATAAGGAGPASTGAGPGGASGGALQAIACAVDALERDVEAAAAATRDGGVPRKEQVRLQEMLTRQLLALDAVEAPDDSVREKRRGEVRRVQRLCDRVDALAASGDL